MDTTFAAGGSIPRIGLGTWPMDDTEAARVVAEAIQLGYRLLDTAYNYRNETGVGRGMAASGVPREELFVTTKFNREHHSVSGVAEAWEGSARRLGVDYIDLMLIHWPNPDQDRYVEAWEGLIRLREQGKVRHIGTSNFLPEHLERIVGATGVTPDLDQLQVHPMYSQPEARAYNAAHGILTQSWSPLGRDNGLLQAEVVTSLARRYDCTPGQAVLAWHWALGLGAVPKSANRTRLAENLASEGITLAPADVDALSALEGQDPTSARTHPNLFGH